MKVEVVGIEAKVTDLIKCSRQTVHKLIYSKD